MVGEDKKIPLPVNYRRAVNSPIWGKIALLCLQMRCKPNELIDLLITEEFLRRKKNVQLQRNRGK